MEYHDTFRICKHCGSRLNGLRLTGEPLSNAVFNGRMVEHLRKHDPDTKIEPKPKTHLCQECGEGFTVSHLTSWSHDLQVTRPLFTGENKS